MKLKNILLFTVLFSLSNIGQGDAPFESTEKNIQLELWFDNSHLSNNSGIDKRQCKEGDTFSGYSATYCVCRNGRWIRVLPPAGGPCGLPPEILPSKVYNFGSTLY